MEDAEKAWRAFRSHFKKCRTCAQRDREWAGSQQFCPMGRELFLSEDLTDEDRERLEFQAQMSRLASSRDRFWKKAKAAVKASAEWVAGIGIIVGSLWALTEILAHVHFRIDHDWWAYRVWNFNPFMIVSFALPTTVALFAPMEKNGPARAQCLFTWNSAVAGFWFFLYGIFWSTEEFGPWLGIPLFLAVFVVAGIAWRRLDARFGCSSSKTAKPVDVDRS